MSIVVSGLTKVNRAIVVPPSCSASRTRSDRRVAGRTRSCSQRNPSRRALNMTVESSGSRIRSSTGSESMSRAECSAREIVYSIASR